MPDLADQMLRESGVGPRRLQQTWPRYDAIRIELAVGQFADLASDVRDLPPIEAVLDVARQKSGNYTVDVDRRDRRRSVDRRDDHQPVASARNALGEISIDESVRAALNNMASVCTERAQ